MTMQTSISGPGPGVSLVPCDCWTCKAAAPSWRTVAERMFPGANIAGEGAWALMSCSGRTVRLLDTKDEAHSEMATWRYTRCEHFTTCSGDAGHRIFEMRRA